MHTAQRTRLYCRGSYKGSASGRGTYFNTPSKYNSPTIASTVVTQPHPGTLQLTVLS